MSSTLTLGTFKLSESFSSPTHDEFPETCACKDGHYCWCTWSRVWEGRFEGTVNRLYFEAARLRISS